MNVKAYQLAIETLEGHYAKKFSPVPDIRKKLLNDGFNEVKGCSDASILRAVDAITKRMNFLPNLDALVTDIKREHLKDAKADDDAQEKRAGTYEKYGDRKPLSKNVQDVIKVMFNGRITRREFTKLLQALYRSEGTRDHLGPESYALQCERQGLDFDAPAFTGGIGSIFSPEGE